MNNDTTLDMLQIKIERAKDALPKETLSAINSIDWRAAILGMKDRKGYSFEQLEDLELETELLLCGLARPEGYPKTLEQKLKISRPQADLLVQEMNELVFKKIKEQLIKNSQKRNAFVKKELVDEISNVTKTDIHISSPNIFRAQMTPKIKPVESPSLSKNTGLEVMPEELSTPKQKEISVNGTGILNKRGEAIAKTTNNTFDKNIPKKPLKIIENNQQPKIVIPPKIENFPKKETIPTKETESISSQKLSGSFQIPATKTEYSLNNIPKTENKNTSTPSGLSGALKTSKVDPYRLDPNE